VSLFADIPLLTQNSASLEAISKVVPPVHINIIFHKILMFWTQVSEAHQRDMRGMLVFFLLFLVHSHVSSPGRRLVVIKSVSNLIIYSSHLARITQRAVCECPFIFWLEMRRMHSHTPRAHQAAAREERHDGARLPIIIIINREEKIGFFNFFSV
jgi:hypothetical protein